jgi:hypothetical protein
MLVLIGDARNADAATPIDLTGRQHTIVDTSLISTSSGLSLALHSPELREVVFRFNAPWEGGESGYVTVLRDGATYRMYYRGGGEKTREVTCMAESRDGISWSRPKLGLFDFNGSKDNNIIFTGDAKAYRESHNFTPFVDTNPACEPSARYKALALTRVPGPDNKGAKALTVLSSPDGIHWQHMSKDAVITTGSFDSQNVAFWDAVRGCYACYSRFGRSGVRSVQLSTSTDFLHWSTPQWLDFGPAPLEQFYTNAITPYPREPGLLLGFPMRFVPQRKTVGAEQRVTDGVSDAVFISSRDGVNFQRVFFEAFIRPGPDRLNWGSAHGNNTPCWGLLELAPGEISVYWAEHYLDVPQLRRGVVRTDGFASVHADAGGGEFETRPVSTRGGRLVLNVATSAVGSVRVEVRDATGRPVPGYTLTECDEIYGDEISRLVTWKGSAELGALAGQPISLRFAMKDADFYALRFTDQNVMPPR